MTTISLAEKITYQEAPFFLRRSSATAGDEGANTSQLSPFKIRSASCRETPEVRLTTTPLFFASKAAFNSFIGPASESAWKISTVPAIADPADKARNTRQM